MCSIYLSRAHADKISEPPVHYVPHTVQTGKFAIWYLYLSHSHLSRSHRRRWRENPSLTGSSSRTVACALLHRKRNLPQNRYGWSRTSARTNPGRRDSLSTGCHPSYHTPRASSRGTQVCHAPRAPCGPSCPGAARLKKLYAGGCRTGAPKPL